MKKILQCLDHGTQMGWLIDPDEQTVFVFRPGQAIQALDKPDSALPMPSFVQEFQLTIKDLFAWLLEGDLEMFSAALTDVEKSKPQQ